MVQVMLRYSGQYYRLQPQGRVEFKELWRVMDDIQALASSSSSGYNSIISLLNGYVQSVTDNGAGVVAVDNTDAQNPVVRFTGVFVDGTTVTGDGSSGNPLVAISGGGGDILNPFLLMGG